MKSEPGLAERVLKKLPPLNGERFNLLYALFSFVIIPVIGTHIHLGLGFGVFGLIGLTVYIGEAWAFYYKTRLMRARILYGLTNGNPDKDVPPLPKLGCLINYGFVVRLCLRIIILVFSLMSLGLMNPNGGKPRPLALGILIVATIGEIFVMMFSWMESRLETADETNEERKTGEREWRKSNFPMISDEKLYWKEPLSDLFLFVSAMMYTHFFWTMSNNTFIGYIDQSHLEGSGGFGVLLVILFSNAVLSLFMLVPIRLAYWAIEAISLIDDKQRWRLRVSLIIAGVSMIAPVLIHYARVYWF